MSFDHNHDNDINVSTPAASPPIFTKFSAKRSACFSGAPVSPMKAEAGGWEGLGPCSDEVFPGLALVPGCAGWEGSGQGLPCPGTESTEEGLGVSGHLTRSMGGPQWAPRHTTSG